MSWDELLSIVKEAAAQRRQDRDTPPSACPRCGEPLQTGPTGDLHCTWDGWLRSRDYLRPL